jgi:AbrB family looped-hinge helix DNA binding protein
VFFAVFLRGVFFRQKRFAYSIFLGEKQKMCFLSYCGEAFSKKTFRHSATAMSIVQRMCPFCKRFVRVALACLELDTFRISFRSTLKSADFPELSVKYFVRKFISQINILSDCGVRVIMAEQVKVGLRGQVVIPKKLRKKLNIENGIILEIQETTEGLLLKPCNPVAELKGLGKNVFGEPLSFQRKLRGEWECPK